MFTYKKYVQYYETDAMSVVHHSNYLRYFEEGRVAWLRHHELSQDEHIFAVVETQCRHHRPAYFNDELTVQLQVRRDSGKIHFQYKIFTPRYDTPICTGMTLHILVDKNLKVRKPPKHIVDLLEKEQWIETWLLSS